MHKVYDKRFRRWLSWLFGGFCLGDSLWENPKKVVEIWSKRRWTISMHQEETTSLFQGQLTSLTRSLGPWTETMRTTVLQLFQLSQKLCLRMSRRFSRPLLEPHFSSLQLVCINKPQWSYCCYVYTFFSFINSWYKWLFTSVLIIFCVCWKLMKNLSCMLWKC